MLSPADVVPYLSRLGLVRSDSIVLDGITVVDASRRNRNYRVLREHRPSYLLKQGIRDAGKATVAREAAVYRFLGSIPGRRGLDSVLPRFLTYDDREGVLVMELVGDIEDLSESFARRGPVTCSVAGAMGSAIGRLHRVTDGATADSIGPGVSVIDPAWVFSIHTPDVRLIPEMSGASIRLIRILQRYPDLCERLERLNAEWRASCLIHGDLKSTNWLLPRRATPAVRLKLVDWELAVVGDPCWDVGSVLSDYIALWLFSIPITGETPPERALELTRFPLTRLHPAIRSFWRSYRRERALAPDESASALLKSVHFAAARLIQSALESLQQSILPTGSAVCALQLSWNIMRRPVEAAVQLMGLSAADVEAR